MAAALIVRDAASTARTVTGFLVRDASNVQRTVVEGWIRDMNNVPRLFYNPTGSATLAVSATPESVYGITFGTGTVTTDSTTATASSGTAPYTYAWTLLTHDGPVPPTATSPSSASTTFTQTSMAAGGVYTSEWLVTATDDLGNTATDTVTANFADGA